MQHYKYINIITNYQSKWLERLLKQLIFYFLFKTCFCAEICLKEKGYRDA